MLKEKVFSHRKGNNVETDGDTWAILQKSRVGIIVIIQIRRLQMLSSIT